MDETEVATSIREAMSREYSDCTWQVFVGRNFGSQVSYEETRYIYFYIAQVRSSPKAPRPQAPDAHAAPSAFHAASRLLFSTPFACFPQVGFVVFSST